MAFPFIMLAQAILAKKKAEQDNQEFNRQRDIQAETTRMSPWTGMQAAAPVKPNETATMLEGVGSGWAMQQNLEKSKKQDELFDAYLKKMQMGQGGQQGANFSGDFSPWSNMGSAGIKYYG